MGSVLSEFFDTANRIAGATGLDAIDLGVIWRETSGTHRALLALRGVLRRTEPRNYEEFDAEALHARRVFVPRDDWKELEAGLTRSILTLPSLRVGPYMISHMPIEWEFSPNAVVRSIDVPVVRAATQGESHQDLLGTEAYRSLTPLIAKHSDYEVASFSRLAQRFLGAPLEQQSAGLELLAPWPVQEISVERNGAGVRVLITGLRDLDPECFIVNIESTLGDRRIRPAELLWVTVSRNGTAQYVARIADPEHSILAVNVYFKGIKEIHHRGELRRDIERSPVEGLRPHRHLASQEEIGGKIVQLHVERFRSLRDVRLDLRDLRVLIGPNQAGKSTILDALALLREAVAGSLHDAIFRKRGGFRQILWRGDGPPVMQFDVDIEHAGRQLRYSFILGLAGLYDYIVERESLYERRDDRWQLLVSASTGVAVIDGIEERTEDPRELLLPLLRNRALAEELRTVMSTLASISIFPGFQAGASWAEPGRAEIRQPARIQPGARLEPLAGNLTAVLHALSQSEPERWDELIAVAHLVFPRLQRITFPPAEADRIQLAWHEEGFDRPFFAVDLSDGTLHFLAALCALYQDSSLIAIDEPESHLHPEALYRWMGVVSKVAADATVLVATQSTQLLGFIDDTPGAVVVVRRDPGGTEIIRPDQEELEEWVKRFSLAEIRQEIESWGQRT